MKITFSILILLGSGLSLQLKQRDIITDSQKAEAHYSFLQAVELESKEKHGFNDTKMAEKLTLQQRLVQTFNNKTSYEMQAEEMDREEESAGNVVLPQQANQLMQSNSTTAAYMENSEESVWKNKAQKNADDFDAYSQFMNSKFGSSPAEKPKVVEVGIKKDNATSAVQQQYQQNQTQNITSNVTYKQSLSDPTSTAQVNLTNATKAVDLNSTSEKIKTLKVNETNAIEDSPAQTHHIIDQVLRESDSDKEMDDIMKRVQTDDEKESKVLGEIKKEEISLKQKMTQDMEKEEQSIKEQQQKQDNSTANITTSLPQKNQTANVTLSSNTTNASQDNQTLNVQDNSTMNLTAAIPAIAGQNSSVMEQALMGVIQKYAAKQEEKTQEIIRQQNEQLQDIENRLLERQITKNTERRINVSFGSGIAQAAGQQLVDEQESRDDILSTLNEIQGLDGEDRKKMFAMAQENLKN